MNEAAPRGIHLRPCGWGSQTCASRVGCRQAVLPAVGSHLLLLVGQDAQRGAGFAGTKQYEAGLPILRIITGRIGLIDLAPVQQASGTGKTSSLLAESGQLETGGEGGVPDVLVGAHLDGLFSAGQQESYHEGRGLGTHVAIVWEHLKSCLAFGPGRSGSGVYG